MEKSLKLKANLILLLQTVKECLWDDPILRFLTIGFIFQAIFIFPTWFISYKGTAVGEWIMTLGVKYDNLDWFVVDFCRLMRICLMTLFILGTIILIRPQYWGIGIWFIPTIFNITSVFGDYIHGDKYDEILFTIKRMGWALGFLVLAAQIYKQTRG